RRCATASVMSDIAVVPGRDLAKTAPRTCSRAVAQNNRSPPGQQNAIATSEGNRLRNPFHTQPAVTARKHRKVRQICGWHLFVGRCDSFSALLPPDQAPRGCGFEPVLTESGYVQRSEDVGYRIQCNLPNWTNRQNIWTREQFSSTVKEIYSSVVDAIHRPKG